MKYSVVKIGEGHWAVGNDKRYHKNTITKFKDVAFETASVMSIEWHNEQMQIIWASLAEVSEGCRYDGIKMIGSSHMTKLEDLLS